MAAPTGFEPALPAIKRARRPDLVADLRRRFSNTPEQVKALIEGVLRSKSPRQRGTRQRRITDFRGPNVTTVADPQTTLRPELINELVADHHAGMSTSELGAKYGIHQSTVVRHLRRQGVRFRPRPLDGRARLRAVRLYRSGVPLTRVAADLSVGSRAVRAALVAEGVQIRPPGRQSI